jgi:hypothetical protein
VRLPSVVARLYKADTHSSLSCHFLREDIELQLLPIQNIKRYLSLTIRSEDSDEARRAILKGLTGDDDLFYAEERVADFIRSIARTALYYGDAAYELVLLGLRDESKLFSLESITATSVCRMFGQYFQVLPRADMEQRRLPIILLDRKRTFLVNLPRISAWRWRRIMDSLSKIDKASLSAALNEVQGYDFDLQRRLIERAQLLVTNSVPWVQRQSLRPKQMSGVYFAWRWLKMQLFTFELRDRILDMINGALKCAGGTRGFCAQLELRGLPTIDDAECAIRELTSGAVGPNIVSRFTGF